MPSSKSRSRLNRVDLIGAIRETSGYDLLVIGGGATGLGAALDAALRGLRVALLDAHDFAGGTSSRATKLVHGGVRYLAQGNIGLVREALHERTALLHNAPHLTGALPFVMPSYHWWETPFYGAGLMAYDLLAGSASLGGTRWLGAATVQQHLPTLRRDGLLGGVLYWDGQFDDARLALALARTAHDLGVVLLNHCPVTGLVLEDGRVCGVHARDAETGENLRLGARCVLNAAGVWVDGIRRMETEALGRAPIRDLVAPSQGVHLVVDREFLPAQHALMVPKTADGRVLFAVPWLGKLILGTTDTPRDDLPLEPRPFGHEVDFILGEAARYLQRAPQRSDVRSAWVGMRPLVRPEHEEDAGDTKAISREHTVRIGASGLVTVTGGKWTTYRAMAEDVINRCMAAGLLPQRTGGQTRRYPLAGAEGADTAATRPGICDAPGLHLYGGLARHVVACGGHDVVLAPGLTEAMVRHAFRAEWARNVADVLARRSRLLFLDARLAARVAPRVAELLAEEGAPAPDLPGFLALAQQYTSLPSV